MVFSCIKQPTSDHSCGSVTSREISPTAGEPAWKEKTLRSAPSILLSLWCLWKKLLESIQQVVNSSIIMKKNVNAIINERGN